MTERDPVTSTDLRTAAAWSFHLLSPATVADWTVPAFRLRWSCRKTLDHILDCLAWYAHDLAGEITSSSGAARWGGGRLPLTDLLASIGPLAEVLALVADGKPATARGWHDFGHGDPEGFLAMGTVEILLHTWDIGLGLGLDVGISPEIDAIADRVVNRIFLYMEDTASPFDTLLAATGRRDRPDGTRPTRWRWYTAPLTERV
jgi:hypothetical protein